MVFDIFVVRRIGADRRAHLANVIKFWQGAGQSPPKISLIKRRQPQPKLLHKEPNLHLSFAAIGKCVVRDEFQSHFFQRIVLIAVYRSVFVNSSAVCTHAEHRYTELSVSSFFEFCTAVDSDIADIYTVIN